MVYSLENSRFESNPELILSTRPHTIMKTYRAFIKFLWQLRRSAEADIIATTVLLFVPAWYIDGLINIILLSLLCMTILFNFIRISEMKSHLNSVEIADDEDVTVAEETHHEEKVEE